jgi:hypothetical protein
MRHVPVKDPVTGMITMVPAGRRGLPAAAFWTQLTGEPVPSDAMPTASRAETLDAIALAVLGGGSVDDVVEFQLEMVDEEEAAVFKPLLEGYVATAREAHARVAATWVGDTDNDRLARAFAEMDAAGIVARENLGQSLSDGEYEIDRIVDAKLAAGRTVRGSVFCHEQDVERALGGGGLNLAFTGDRTGAEAARLIGHEVVAILERHGLKPVWNGDSAHRIRIDMVWRRRP